jgi:hypothetical protein
VETDSRWREESGARWLDAAASSDVPAILEELHRSGYGTDELARQLLRRWVEIDPQAAAAWASLRPADRARGMVLTDVALQWALVDVGAAAAWANQLPGPTERQNALLAVASEAVRGEPMEALRLAVEMPAGADRDETIRRAAMEWAVHDGRQATEWARQIADAVLREKVLAAGAVAWAETAPEAAAGCAVGSLSPGRLMEDTVVSIVQRWAQQQPIAAHAWAERFLAGDLKETAVAAIRTLQAPPPE